MTLPKIPPEFEELSTSEKIEYVQKLWENIAESSTSVELTPEQRTELDRRIDAHKTEPGNTSTWAEVKERIRGNE